MVLTPPRALTLEDAIGWVGGRELLQAPQCSRAVELGRAVLSGVLRALCCLVCCTCCALRFGPGASSVLGTHSDCCCAAS